MKRVVLALALSSGALGGCGMRYEECRGHALKEWQKCSGEAIRNDYPRPGALGDCERKHRRKDKACEGLPKEGRQAERRAP